MSSVSERGVPASLGRPQENTDASVCVRATRSPWDRTERAGSVPAASLTPSPSLFPDGKATPTHTPVTAARSVSGG